MHFKRRRRRAGRVVLFVLAAVLLAALGTGMWLLWPRAMRRDMPSAAAPQGTLRGLRLSWSYPTAAGGLSSGGPEVLDTLFADAAAYAQAHGLNVLFLDVADAELSSIAFRDRAYETWPGAAADDSLFHKYDPLRALCEQASQAGLAVYAVTPELSGNADWEAALARMQKKYAVAGLYVEGSALFDSISRQAVFYADEAAFNDPSSLFLASLDTDGFHGAVFDYARCRAQPEAFSVLASALDGSAARPALLEYTPGGTLAVSYPADGAAVYTSACFVMGTSDPAQELLLNGTPVESRGPGGTFGVLVDVAEGSNVYTLTQGGTSVSVTVNRPAPAGGGSGGTTEVPHDDTAEVEPGTPVRIRNWIASLLYDPASDGNISETVRQGAVATVAACTETLRGGKRTWAYQLASGDFVLAYNAEPLPPETPRASFNIPRDGYGRGAHLCGQRHTAGLYQHGGRRADDGFLRCGLRGGFRRFRFRFGAERRGGSGRWLHTRHAYLYPARLGAYRGICGRHHAGHPEKAAGAQRCIRQASDGSGRAAGRRPR